MERVVEAGCVSCRLGAIRMPRVRKSGICDLVCYVDTEVDRRVRQMHVRRLVYMFQHKVTVELACEVKHGGSQSSRCPLDTEANDPPTQPLSSVLHHHRHRIETRHVVGEQLRDLRGAAALGGLFVGHCLGGAHPDVGELRKVDARVVTAVQDGMECHV